MSDTFTKNYNWTKPDVGASDDTWGDKLNANLDAIDADLRAADDKTGLPEAPLDNRTYGRDNGAWVALPQSYMPEAPNTSQRFGRYNSVWQLDAIQTDAPNDGGAYARQSGAWTAAVTGGPYLPLIGGTLTGPLILQGSNMVALNAPLTGGGQAAILGQKATINRWQMMLGDQTAEGTGNAGSNFALNAFNATGGMLGTWLTIARADGAVTFNGSGVTIAGGLAVNGALTLAGPGNLAILGGTNGQVLSTNGSGVLSWATRLADAPSDGQFYTRQNAAWAVSPGGMTDAPNDGTAYARKSAAWAHLTHTDITDWTATLAPYALTTAVPVGSNAAPLMDGTAAAGSSAAWARGDHVHPTDTSRYAASNPSGYQTAAQVTAVLPPASTTLPLVDGVGAVGVGTTFARADHVHPLPPQAIGDNRVINGDMRINQRAAAGTTIGYTVDRWQLYASQTGKGTWGAGSVFGIEFPYGLQFLSSTAYASLAADAFEFFQPIEADMVSDFQWGTAQAKPVTLSFWVSASVAGTYSGSIANVAGTRSYPFSFPVTTGWSKVIIPISADTGGTWVMSGNAGSLNVCFDLGSGATYRGPANAWASANYVGVTGARSVVGTNGASFAVTGVKLEIGSVATPFNRQSLAKSMADCQRYYQRLGGVIAEDLIFQGYASATGQALASVIGIAAMRAAPTATRVGAWGNVGNLASYSLFGGLSTVGVQMNAAGAGQTTMFSDVGDYISLSAEL